MSLLRRMRGEFRIDVLAVVVPVGVAVALLGLFIVPNYVRARQWEREAFTLRAVANHTIEQQNDLVDMQARVQALRAEVARRGRRLPSAPDQGLLLDGLTRSAEVKGMISQDARTGPLRRVPVPGLAGGAAARRSVDAQMQGSFDALFQSMQAAESLPTLVTVRSVDMVRSPSAAAGEGVQATFSFDEYFAEAAAADPAAAPRTEGGRP